MKAAKNNPAVQDFLNGKPAGTLALFDHFIAEYKKLGDIAVLPAKTMIGIGNDRKRIAWITHFGKNFIHVVFPFKKPFADNLCFLKIAQVPGQQQFNHHFRMYYKEDINDEVMQFMKLAYENE